MSKDRWDIVVIGAGAAGLFAALRAKELSPHLRVLIVEKGPKPLRKVSISGGGRCNVTHACYDLDRLLTSYPRGGHRLEAIFGRFMPQNTIDWFQERGVKLKTESDGRMFPVTDSSQTIIDCLLGQAHKLGVSLETKVRVEDIEPCGSNFHLQAGSRKIITSKLLLATGGASKATSWLKSLGHEIIADIPSLFTFCCKDPLFQGLQGLSVDPVELTLKTEPEYESTGPFLITHWGVSGPAVLRLSAFAARTLFENNYRASLIIDFLPDFSHSELRLQMEGLASPKLIQTTSPFPTIPKRLWRELVTRGGVKKNQSWQSLKPPHIEKLLTTLKQLQVELDGKGVFKEEFVTAGGLPLHEVDVYTMESRRVPGLFVAGELLNVDGITGGFNFQNAWATGYIAGEAMAMC